MDKKSILRAFNEHFLEFMHPKLLLVTFSNEFSNKYREQINNSNIDFFINNNYSDSVRNAESASTILDKINLLREPIRNMDESDKNKTIQYIQNLTKLSDMYYA